MSNKSNVTLTVLSHQAEKAEALFSTRRYTHQETSGPHYSWYFEDVKYGELPFLGALEEAGIAYNSEWDQGNEYGSGGTYCRFTSEGEIVEKELFDNENCLFMDVLAALMDNPSALRHRILAKIEERALLPLDADQIVYGARYRMRQLITP